MADSKIDINFVASGVDSGGSNDVLVSVLNKLNLTLEKLSASNPLNKASAVNATGATKDADKTISEMASANDKAIREMGTKIASTLTTAISAAITITTMRVTANDNAATMGRATAAGRFMADAVAGNANSSFGNYVNELWGVAKTNKQANNSAEQEGLYGGIGATVAKVVSTGVGAVNKTAGNVVDEVATYFGAGLGASYGATQATKGNALTEQEYMLRGAEMKRYADASVSQGKTAFSRWGGSTYSQQLAASSMTASGKAINVDLQKEFTNMYGKSQNFKAIQENIAPYMNKSPLSDTNGNLDKVSENFLRAGFAVGDFSRLTTQASQYAALTGKNLQDFSKDLEVSRARFGDSYDAGTNQTALNLMALGYGKDNAQHLAYQSQFNSGIGSSIGQWANQSVGDYYKNQALSQSVGFDINKSLQNGHISGASKETLAELRKETANYQKGSGEMGPLLTLLNASGTATFGQVMSLLQPQAAEKKLTKAEEKAIRDKRGGLEGNEQAPQASSVEGLMAKMDNMNVTTMTVTNFNVDKAKTPTPAPSMTSVPNPPAKGSK